MIQLFTVSHKSILKKSNDKKKAKKKKDQVLIIEKKQKNGDTATERRDATDSEGVILTSVLFDYTLPKQTNKNIH